MKNIHLITLAAMTLTLLCACEPQTVYRKPPKPIEYNGGVKEDEKKKEEAIDTSGLKLMSFNIRYASVSDSGDKSWSRRKSAVCEMINTQKPVIMGVQECLIAQKKDILAGCKDYEAIGVGRDDGKESGEMMAIFYKKSDITIEAWGTFWLSLTPDVPSKDWSSACRRCATWARIKINATGEKIFYVNTHLDHQNGQTEQMAILEDKMSELNTEKLPMFLTADFNVVQDDPLFDHVQTYMSNARKTAPITDDVKSYNSWGKAGSAKFIDIIFYSTGSVKPQKFCTVTGKYDGLTYISDHYPIYGIFEL